MQMYGVIAYHAFFGCCAIIANNFSLLIYMHIYIFYYESLIIYTITLYNVENL